MNFVNNEIKRAEKAFYKTKLAENANNPDQFWKTIKEIYPTKSKNNTIFKTFKVDDGAVPDTSVISNKFCTFSLTVANKLKKVAFPIKLKIKDTCDVSHVSHEAVPSKLVPFLF